MWFKKKKRKINYDSFNYKPIDREVELQKIRDEIASRPKYYPTLWLTDKGLRVYSDRIEWITKEKPKIYAGQISAGLINPNSTQAQIREMQRWLSHTNLFIDEMYGEETRQIAGLYKCFQSLAEVEKEMATIDQLLDEFRMSSWSYTYRRK